MTEDVALPARSTRRLALGLVARMTPAMLGSNALGAGVVYVYLAHLVPDPPGGDRLGTANLVVFLSYVGSALLLGTGGSVLLVRRLLRWLRRDHDIGDRDRHVTLALPGRLVRLYGALWGVAVLLFAGLNLGASFLAALQVAVTTTLGGLTTCALCYLLAERAVRPLVQEAMRGTTAPPPVLLGTQRRLLLAWALGSGVPLTGILSGLVVVRGEAGRIGPGAVGFLAVLGLVVGGVLTLFAARSVVDPVQSVTRALRDVGAGRLGTQVPVYDASEVGQLQSGFNAMVGGLRERERLRDLFGRQVGSDVARLALEQGVRLGGERRDVAVLFVDVVGSTALAQELGPEEVVARLNAFFGVVVDVVTAHHGWVNKFEGDAALCVFGAPADLPDAAACALSAARELVRRLEPLPLSAAVGVSAGPVVAGHVGAESRFEYTVVGDPVNAAARLTELAKAVPGRVLADLDVVEATTTQEQQCWEPGDVVVLRGRSTPTRLAVPRG
ncbi:MAG: adenylate/guanylate cyclase with integral rane sensor [Frankiales bacterium]|nr:adenylate/guanylate cyclase with integral rane sensor [Frankiales bacterium]